MRFCIIGANGNIGSFYSKLLKDYQVHSIEQENYNELENKLTETNIILVAVPFDKISGVLKDIKDKVKKEHLVINLTSLMQANLQDMKELPCASAFLHGLFAPNINSIKNANFILAPIKKNKHLQDFTEFLKNNGANIHESSVEDHDKSMAVIQALSHFNSILLAKTISDTNVDSKNLQTYCTLFFRMYFDAVSRIFSQTPEMYANLQFYNEQFNDILKLYKQNLKHLESIVENKDHNQYNQIFASVQENLGKHLKDSFMESKTLAEKLNGKKTKTALLGPAGSFTDEAAKKHSENSEKMYFDNIKDIINAVKEGMTDYAIVPLENSIGGTIAEAIDQIYINKLKIEKVLILPIEYCAASLSRSTEPEIIMGHPQAFVQCSDFIEKNYPDVKVIHTLSNSEAFKKIKENGLINALALGPSYAADIYGLNIIEKNVEDNPNNKTRFAVITKKKHISKKGNKSSVVIDPGKDRPGLLFDLLKYFKEKDINLCRIESRPSKDKLGVYVFHVEFDGNIHEDKIQSALKEIEKDAKVTYIGSYREEEI